MNWLGLRKDCLEQQFFLPSSRLYRLRPGAAHLTEFYALLSLGGVLGGIFAALLSPILFTSVIEYPLLAFAALFARDDIWRTPVIEPSVA